MLRTIPHRLLNLPAFLASGALFALMILTFGDVMLRSVLNAPIEIAADLTRLLMAILVFSVMPTVSATGRQISVDLLEQQFVRLGLARWLEPVVNLVCGTLLLWPAERVLVLAERSRSYGDVMEYLGLPVHYVGWFVALMTALTAVSLIARGLIGLFHPALLRNFTHG